MSLRNLTSEFFMTDEQEEIRTMEMLLDATWYPIALEFRKYRELGQGMMTVDRWDRQGNLLDWNAK